MIDEGVRRQFPGAAGCPGTASLGLPPRSAVDELTAAIAAEAVGPGTALVSLSLVQSSDGHIADDGG